MASVTSNVMSAKDPSDVVDYGIDWTDLLTAESDTIASSTWSSVSTPSGLTILSDHPYEPTTSGMFSYVWVSGGTAGVDYTVTCTIVTSGHSARTHQRSIVIPCEDR